MHQSPYRKRGKPLSTDEKWMVVQVFNQCDQERKCSRSVETKDAHTRTTNYTGVGRRQVVDIIRCFNETGCVPPPVVAGNRTVHQTNISAVAEESIRKFIFNKHLAGEVCNASHVSDLLKKITAREIPHSTICDHLQRMGFTYSRTRKKTRSLREKPYVRQQRHSYLHDIRQLRNSDYTTVYLDESFLHHYHGHQFSWFNDEIGDYLERPAGKGRRWCFIHAMLETGLVPNACYIFEAKKSTGDYHGMFNALHFQEWWIEKLTPNLPRKCVIVIDRASFHLVPEEQVIPTSMRKAELQEWLTLKNISWENHWLKPILIQQVDMHIDKTPLVQKISENIGHRVLLLPVHHPELNPIELVWGIVKNECGRLLREGTKFVEVREHLKNALSKITAATCSKLFKKIQDQESEYWNTDVKLEKLDEEL